MSHVFVSYSRKDSRRLEQMVARLKELRLDVWFDSQLKTGHKFPDQLEEKAKSAACVLVLWSQTAAKSDWVRREAAIGFVGNKLCSVRLDSADLPPQFSSIHTLDLSDPSFSWGHEPWLQLLDRIGLLVGRRDLRHFSQSLAKYENLLSEGGGHLECKTIEELRPRHLDKEKEEEWPRRIARRLVSVDYATYDDLLEEDEGTIGHWAEIVDRTPESFMLLMLRLPVSGEGSMIVGSWSVFSVSEELFGRLKDGSATSDNLPPSQIGRITPGKDHYLYFDNISRRPELPDIAGAILLQNIAITFIKWRLDGIRIREIVAHQYAKVGRRLAKKYGLEPLAKRTRYGEIYWQSGEELDRRLLGG